jgi:hypothetical protein
MERMDIYIYAFTTDGSNTARYDISSNSWLQDISQAPTGNEGTRESAYYNGSIYFGSDKDWIEYDIGSDSYTTLTSNSNISTYGSNHLCFERQGSIYHGVDGDTKLQEYDIGSDSWSKVTDLEMDMACYDESSDLIHLLRPGRAGYGGAYYTYDMSTLNEERVSLAPTGISGSDAFSVFYNGEVRFIDTADPMGFYHESGSEEPLIEEEGLYILKAGEQDSLVGGNPGLVNDTDGYAFTPGDSMMLVEGDKLYQPYDIDNAEIWEV